MLNPPVVGRSHHLRLWSSMFGMPLWPPISSCSISRSTAKGSKFLPITISGVKGYQYGQPPTIIPGSQITDTHTDYYLMTPDFEYQISTDAVSDDNATSALAGHAQQLYRC